MNTKLALGPATNKNIRSDKITILINNPSTGEEVRRELPVSFIENQLGIWLEGKDEFGDSQAIVFLSEFGAIQLNEIIGGDVTTREVNDEQKTAN